jgi:hypothetical protein
MYNHPLVSLLLLCLASDVVTAAFSLTKIFGSIRISTDSLDFSNAVVVPFKSSTCFQVPIPFDTVSQTTALAVICRGDGTQSLTQDLVTPLSGATCSAAAATAYTTSVGSYEPVYPWINSVLPPTPYYFSLLCEHASTVVSEPFTVVSYDNTCSTPYQTYPFANAQSCVPLISPGSGVYFQATCSSDDTQELLFYADSLCSQNPSAGYETANSWNNAKGLVPWPSLPSNEACFSLVCSPVPTTVAPTTPVPTTAVPTTPVPSTVTPTTHLATTAVPTPSVPIHLGTYAYASADTNPGCDAVNYTPSTAFANDTCFPLVGLGGAVRVDCFGANSAVYTTPTTPGLGCTGFFIPVVEVNAPCMAGPDPSIVVRRVSITCPVTQNQPPLPVGTFQYSLTALSSNAAQCDTLLGALVGSVAVDANHVAGRQCQQVPNGSGNYATVLCGVYPLVYVYFYADNLCSILLGSWTTSYTGCTYTPFGQFNVTCTAVPTTAPVPTTAVPTTPIPTTAVPTTRVPTTVTPTTQLATTAAPSTNSSTIIASDTPASNSIQAAWTWFVDAVGQPVAISVVAASGVSLVIAAAKLVSSIGTTSTNVKFSLLNNAAH